MNFGVWALCAVALSQLGSCGYTVVRADRLFAAHRITVLPFFEETPANMAGTMAYHTTRLLAAGGMHVVQDADDTDALLDGTITLTTQGSATLGGVRTYQTGARVDARLRSRDGNMLWRHMFDVAEDFLPVEGNDTQPIFTETNRRAAILRLAERAARQLHEAMVLAQSQKQV